MRLSILIICLIWVISCSKTENKPIETNEQETLKPVTELTYSEIVDKVMFGVGEHIEYHGEPINEEAKAEVELIIEGECGEDACGQTVKIINNGSSKVKVTLYVPFKVTTMESHASRIFNLEAGESAEVGCSHFCYAGNSYAFQHTISGAEYVVE